MVCTAFLATAPPELVLAGPGLIGVAFNPYGVSSSAPAIRRTGLPGSSQTRLASEPIGSSDIRNAK